MGVYDKAKAARSPIRRNTEGRDQQQRHRWRQAQERMNDRRQQLVELGRQRGLTIVDTRTNSTSPLSISSSSSSGTDLHTRLDNTIATRYLPPTNVPSRLGPNSHLAALLDRSHDARSPAVNGNIFTASLYEPRQSTQADYDRVRLFAPAHHFWEENDMRRSSSTTPVPHSRHLPSVRTTRDRPRSPRSPDAIVHNELRSEQPADSQREQDAGLYFDGASDLVTGSISTTLNDVREAIGSARESIDAARARLGLSARVGGSRDTIPAVPRMNINPNDGLGDRRRSVSQEGSPAEENWTSLFSTIPPDEHLPSASSSFASASASASSSLSSRGRPRSSLTTLTAPDTRATSAETSASPTADAIVCPEPSGQTRDSGTPRSNSAERETTERSERLIRYWESPNPVRNGHREQEDTEDDEHMAMNEDEGVGQYERESLNRIEERLDRFERLDSILNRMEQQQPVPEEMWVSAGLTPHLGLRGGADRIMQRQRL